MEPKKPSIAVAYSVKRQARKKMAQGGEVKPSMDSRDEREMEMLEEKATMPMADDEDDRELDMMRQKSPKDGAIKFARGGVVDGIMKKRKMAEGGEVELQDSNGDEQLNLEDQLSYEAGRNKTYFDDSEMDDQPEDSNEMDRDIPSDDHDMVSLIRNKMKSKR